MRTPRSSTAAPPARQDGAVVVEFAAVFVLFALLLSGLIQYGVIFAAQQSLSHAAAEATRAVVNIADVDDDGSAQDEAEARVAEVVRDQVEWLDGEMDASDGDRVDYQVDFTGCPECIEVTISYDWAGDPLVPSLFRIATPATLSATANARWQ